MKVVWMVLMASLLLGCAKQDANVDLVKQFWQAMAAGDAEALKPLLSDPRQAEFLANISLAIESYEVLDATQDGVNVKFVRHCYPDVIVPTIVVQKDGVPKVNFMATLQAQMKQMAGVEPTQQYCYEFKDQPMQGVINGQPWQARHVHRQVVDFGNRTEEKIAIYADACPQDNCFMVATPSILISKLDFSGAGGNLDNKKNVTLYTPPGNNVMVTQGSYRLFKSAEGKTRLEISFNHDAENAINGYIEYE